MARFSFEFSFEFDREETEPLPLPALPDFEELGSGWFFPLKAHKRKLYAPKRRKRLLEKPGERWRRLLGNMVVKTQENDIHVLVKVTDAATLKHLVGTARVETALALLDSNDSAIYVVNGDLVPVGKKGILYIVDEDEVDE